jgi:hypothetical protein
MGRYAPGFAQLRNKVRILTTWRLWICQHLLDLLHLLMVASNRDRSYMLCNAQDLTKATT